MKTNIPIPKVHVSESNNRKKTVIERYFKEHPSADKDFQDWAKENKIKYASLDADYTEFCGVCALAMASDGETTVDKDCVKNGMVSYFKSLMADDTNADGEETAETILDRIRLNDIKERILETDIVEITKKAKTTDEYESKLLNESFNSKVNLLKEIYHEDLQLLESLSELDNLKFEIALDNKQKKGVFARIWNGVALENDYENANGKGWKKFKSKIGGAGKLAKKITLAPVRGAVQAMLKVNGFNLAGRLGKLKTRPAEYEKVLVQWEKFGGKRKNLDRDITKNMNKPALPSFRKKSKKAGFDGDNTEFDIKVGSDNKRLEEINDDFGYSSVAGEGIAAVSATASAFLVALIPIFKKNKDITDEGVTGDPSEDAGLIAGSKAEAKQKLAQSGLTSAQLAQAYKLIDSGMPLADVARKFGVTIEEDGIPTWLWWVGGGLLGVGAIAVILLSSKKKVIL